MDRPRGVVPPCPGTTPTASAAAAAPDIDPPAVWDRLVYSLHLDSLSPASPSTLALHSLLPDLKSMDGADDNMAAPEPLAQQQATVDAAAAESTSLYVRSLDPKLILENLLRTTQPSVDELLMRLIQDAPPSPGRDP